MEGVVAFAAAEADILLLHHHRILLNLLQVLQHVRLAQMVAAVIATELQVLCQALDAPERLVALPAHMLHNLLDPALAALALVRLAAVVVFLLLIDFVDDDLLAICPFQCPRHHLVVVGQYKGNGLGLLVLRRRRAVRRGDRLLLAVLQLYRLEHIVIHLLLLAGRGTDLGLQGRHGGGGGRALYIEDLHGGGGGGGVARTSLGGGASLLGLWQAQGLVIEYFDAGSPTAPAAVALLRLGWGNRRRRSGSRCCGLVQQLHARGGARRVLRRRDVLHAQNLDAALPVLALLGGAHGAQLKTCGR